MKNRLEDTVYMTAGLYFVDVYVYNDVIQSANSIAVSKHLQYFKLLY